MKKPLLFILLLLSANIYSSDIFDNAWYKCLKGVLGNDRATLHLVKTDSSVRGYVYFDSNMHPLRVLGTLSGDSLSIINYSESSVFVNFAGIFKNGTYKGVGDRNEEKDKFPFEFTVERTRSDYFDFDYVNKEEKLIKGFDKSPTATYTEAMIWPKPKLEQYEFLRCAIADLKKFPKGISSYNGVMKNNMKNFFSEYFKENEATTKKEIEESDYMTSSLSQEEEDFLVPAYYDSNLLVLSGMYYSFMGGAHGNYGTQYTSIDLKNKRVLKLSDILTGDGLNAMPKLLEKYYRKQFAVDDTTSLINAGLFVDTINVNDNFCLTPGALMFCFVTYEISSYAAGEISIFIPLAELDQYLKPDLKKLLK